MNMRVSFLLTMAPLMLLSFSTPSWGQAVRKSQRGTVSQMIATTEVAVVYNRPVARGRELFGALVPYDRIWQPGANEATTIEVSTDVYINGALLPQGIYSLWTIPRDGDWTFIFSKQASVWHTRYPEGQDALRIEVTPEQGSHMEVMAYYFPLVGPDSATLNFHWGETILPLSITLNALENQ